MQYFRIVSRTNDLMNIMKYLISIKTQPSCSSFSIQLTPKGQIELFSDRFRIPLYLCNIHHSITERPPAAFYFLSQLLFRNISIFLSFSLGMTFLLSSWMTCIFRLLSHVAWQSSPSQASVLPVIDFAKALRSGVESQQLCEQSGAQ